MRSTRINDMRAEARAIREGDRLRRRIENHPARWDQGRQPQTFYKLAIYSGARAGGSEFTALYPGDEFEIRHAGSFSFSDFSYTYVEWFTGTVYFRAGGETGLQYRNAFAGYRLKFPLGFGGPSLFVGAYGGNAIADWADVTYGAVMTQTAEDLSSTYLFKAQLIVYQDLATSTFIDEIQYRSGTSSAGPGSVSLVAPAGREVTPP